MHLVLLADKKRAIIFTMVNGAMGDVKELVINDVPQKVKHGENAWDAQDKINRHIEDHLHRHLQIVAKEMEEFSKDKKIDQIVLGGHKALFAKIIKHLPLHIRKKISGTFVSELKIPVSQIARHARLVIDKLEEEKELKKLEARLAH